MFTYTSDVFITTWSSSSTYEINNEDDDDQASQRTSDNYWYEAVFLVWNSHCGAMVS